MRNLRGRNVSVDVDVGPNKAWLIVRWGQHAIEIPRDVWVEATQLLDDDAGTVAPKSLEERRTVALESIAGELHELVQLRREGR